MKLKLGYNSRSAKPDGKIERTIQRGVAGKASLDPLPPEYRTTCTRGHIEAFARLDFDYRALVIVK